MKRIYQVIIASGILVFVTLLGVFVFNPSPPESTNVSDLDSNDTNPRVPPAGQYNIDIDSGNNSANNSTMSTIADESDSGRPDKTKTTLLSVIFITTLVLFVMGVFMYERNTLPDEIEPANDDSPWSYKISKNKDRIDE